MSIPSLLPTGAAPAVPSASASDAGSADDFHALMREHLDRTADRRVADHAHRAERRDAQPERVPGREDGTDPHALSRGGRAATRPSTPERKNRDADRDPDSSATAGATLAGPGAATAQGLAAACQGSATAAGAQAAGVAAGPTAPTGAVGSGHAGTPQAGSGAAGVAAAQGAGAVGATTAGAQDTGAGKDAGAGVNTAATLSATTGDLAGAGRSTTRGVSATGPSSEPGTAPASGATAGNKAPPDGAARNGSATATGRQAGDGRAITAGMGPAATGDTAAARGKTDGSNGGAVTTTGGAQTDRGSDAKQDLGVGSDLAAVAGQAPHAQAGSAAAPASAAAASQAAGPSNAVLDQVLPVVPRLVMRGDGTQRLTLKLHPADLGEVRLTVTVKNGAVDVTMAAGHEARDALRDGSAQLRSLLQLTGHTTGQVVIRDLPASAASSPTPQPGPDAQGQQSQQGQQGFSGGDASPMFTGDGSGHGRPQQSPDRSATSGSAVRPAAREPMAPRLGARAGASSLDVRI